MKKTIIACFILGVLLSVTDSKAQEAILESDTAVRTGKLPNGFQYYIRANQEPKGRATIYLANKVGSILEEDGERGIAHFIEHMNFNGTKHFPKNELITYLERSGVKFGADLNAYTSFDETVYQLPLPTDDSSLWKNGLQIMRDWAADALLEKAEFERERGVILEEKRLRENAAGRMSEQYRPALFNHGRYAQRMPIGKDSVIKKADVAIAKAFYKRWYRPDLQALIVVGDIDVKQVEKQIIAVFSDLPPGADPAPREQFNISLQDSTVFVRVTDPEYSQYVVQYFFKRYKTSLRTETDFQKQLIERLLNSLFDARLRYVYNQKKPSYLGMSGGLSPLVANLQALELLVNLNPEQVKEGFMAFWTEMERIRRFGFTEQELAEAKARTLRSMQITMAEKEKIRSVNYADSYLQSFLYGDAYLSLEESNRLTGSYLEHLQPNDLQAELASFFNSKDRMILVRGPEKPNSGVPDSTALADWQQLVQSQKIEPFTAEMTTTKLLDRLPVAGRILKEEKNDELGLTHWKLSNGMNVYLKTTDFKNDEILFSLFSKGGTSLYDAVDYPSAKNAVPFILSSGLGNFNANQLEKVLNEKVVNVQPYIADRSEGISTASSVKDFSTALEMVHLYMTQARLDTARFAMIIEQSKAALRNRAPNASRDFTDTINYVLGGYHPRRKPTAIADLDQINTAAVRRIFRERFVNAADFTCVMIGNLPVDSTRMMVEHYLASLPGKGKHEQARDLHIRVPERRIRKDLTGNKGDKASVQIVISGNYEFAETTNLYLDLMKSSLAFRLNERLREGEGGVYSPGVYITKTKEPIGFYAFTISFDCDPARMEVLIKAVDEEFDLLMKSGINEDDLQKFVAEELRAHQVNERTNGFWLTYLKEQMETDEPLEAVLKYNHALDQLTTKESAVYTKKFMNRANEIIFTLRP